MMSYELERIGEPYRECGWNHYHLALGMGTSPNNIGNLFRHTTIPSILTVRRICGVIGITVAQFCSTGNVQVTLNEQQRQIMGLYDKSDPLDKSRIEAYMEGLPAKMKDIQRQNGSQRQPRTSIWKFPHTGWAAFLVFYVFFALQLRFSVFPTCFSHR